MGFVSLRGHSWQCHRATTVDDSVQTCIAGVPSSHESRFRHDMEPGSSMTLLESPPVCQYSSHQPTTAPVTFLTCSSMCMQSRVTPSNDVCNCHQCQRLLSAHHCLVLAQLLLAGYSFALFMYICLFLP